MADFSDVLEAVEPGLDWSPSSSLMSLPSLFASIPDWTALLFINFQQSFCIFVVKPSLLTDVIDIVSLLYTFVICQKKR